MMTGALRFSQTALPFPTRAAKSRQASGVNASTAPALSWVSRTMTRPTALPASTQFPPLLPE
jgi:hypothetical protein